MKKIYFFHHLHEDIKGLGDEIALLNLSEGLKAQGIETAFTNNIRMLAEADFIFLSNMIYDLNPYYNALKLLKKPYGVINFHHDFIQFEGPSLGFHKYVSAALEDSGNYPLGPLLEIPDMIYYFMPSPKLHALINYEVFKNAKICIASSATEARTIKRDCPSAKVGIVHWGCGILDQFQPYSDSFLKRTGLSKGEYILQIGRLSTRKNQMGTILATRDLEMPLVLISSHILKGAQQERRKWIEAVLKWRKAPTVILTEDHPPLKEKHLTIIQLERGAGLSRDEIISAYQNAGLYLHPAFNELPGFVYLEAAKLGIPTVASEWTSLKDYFTDAETEKYTLDDRISYCKPHYINEIEQLVKKKFGKKYKEGGHPAFSRNFIDAGRDILALLNSISI